MIQTGAAPASTDTVRVAGSKEQPVVDQWAIDDVLGEGFLGDLAERSTAELRKMRASCETLGTELSYRRRVLHGHMDLLHDELRGREATGEAGRLTILLDSLRSTTSAVRRSPSHQDVALVEIDMDALPVSADLPDCSDQELRARAEVFVAQERIMSDQRKAVFSRLDAVQDEVVRRYREGLASVDEILPGPA